MKMKTCFGLFYNKGLKYCIQVIWCAVSGFLFWRTYEHYKNGLEYVYLHEILGTWLCVARGSAAVLNINCAVILLPMCHAVVWLFNILAGKANINIRWLELETKAFHIFIGHVILIATGVHVMSHIVNIISFCDNFHEEFRDVNPFPHRSKAHAINIIFGTVTGITGLLMVTILCVLFLTSLKIVRRRFFNVFWYSHRIFVVFYILLAFHGFRGPLRKQMNIDHHIPGCHRAHVARTTAERSSNMTHNFPGLDSNGTCSELPTFGPIGCETWIWIGVPVVIYLSDILCRILRRAITVRVTDVTHISDCVIELSMIKANLKLRPGQYVCINCGQISTLEWHPFTIVQVPTSMNGWILKVWIKSSGDWTGDLVEQTKHTIKAIDGEDPMIRYPSMQLDGPYCSSMQSITKYRVAVCIAGGLGITPFLSHLTYQADNCTKKSKLQTIHLVVIVRDAKLLKQCHAVIRNAQRKMCSRITVDAKFFYTGTTLVNESAELMAGLSKGRPSIEQIFRDIHASYKRCSVGVFVCGPPSLCSDVTKQSNKHSTIRTKFICHKESF